MCWQSDGYGVLRRQGCTVGGFHGKNHNNQSSVTLCKPRTVTSSHSTTTPCTAHNRCCCFCRLTHGHTSRLYHVLQRFGWTILDHPPSSVDLAPSDFHAFPAIKDRLSGHRFAGDEDMKTAVTRWFISGCPEFYEAGINKLAPRVDKWWELCWKIKW